MPASTSDPPCLWTSWLDYSATGEGRTLMLRTTCASSEDDAKRKFQEQFGDYFAQGCEAQVGVVRNEVPTYVLSDAALRFASRSNGNLDICASLHVNFS